MFNSIIKAYGKAPVTKEAWKSEKEIPWFKEFEVPIVLSDPLNDFMHIMSNHVIGRAWDQVSDGKIVLDDTTCPCTVIFFGSLGRTGYVITGKYKQDPEIRSFRIDECDHEWITLDHKSSIRGDQQEQCKKCEMKRRYDTSD